MFKKIVFMGTPNFSVSIMKSLYQNGYPICAVYTQPPNKSKRGQKINKSPVQKLAENFNLNIKNPNFLSQNDEELKYFKSLNADIVIVVIDANEKNNELKKKFSSCYKTLMELGVKRQNLLFAFNKTESMNDEEILEKVKQLDLLENKNWIAISAKSGKNIEKLKMLIKQNFDSTTKINSAD